MTAHDKKHHHILLTELHEVAGAREAKIPSRYRLTGSLLEVNVVQDTIVEIDFKKQQLIGQRAKYGYDELIIGTGATTADFNIPG